MKDLFDSAYRLVHTGERCVLAMIRKSSGSTPRGQGAGMLVLEDGSVRCTIGGGFLEWSAVETARDVLAVWNPVLFRTVFGILMPSKARSAHGAACI